MSSGPFVIGLDIGTTSTCGVLFSPAARSVQHAVSLPMRLLSPEAGWSEQSPDEWWSNCLTILRDLAEHASSGPILGLCVTGMVPTLVALDRNDRLLRNSIQQGDGRCGAEVEALRSQIDEARFLQRTGNGINQQLLTPKLMWLSKHEPSVFSQIRTVIGSYDYITYRLTGEKRVDVNWALEAGFYDIQQERLDSGLIELSGLPRAVIPASSVSREIVGRVTPHVCSQTGLPSGLPVYGGAADHIASALASGVVKDGDTLLKFGGAGDIVVASTHLAPDSRLFLDLHLAPGLYAPNGCMATSGAAVNWLERVLADGAESRQHRELDYEATTVAPGADGLVCLPYFLGEKTPIHDPYARGAFVNLSLNHTRAHIWRALLESVAFGFRHHIGVLQELGHHCSRLIASDGGSRSTLWMQIVADVMGRPVHVVENSHGSALGAAAVAAVGSGCMDWADVADLAKEKRTIAPGPQASVVYDERFRQYRTLYEALATWYREQNRTPP